MSTEPDPYIYADNAATTPLSPTALHAMMPYLTSTFGNPGGIHRVARKAAEALASARGLVADLLGAQTEEIYFTSGGSESDNWVLHGAVRRYRDIYGADVPVRIITSAIEHHAVLHTCQALKSYGVTTEYLPVDREGFVRPDTLRAALEKARKASLDAGVDAPGVALVSVMLANNEVGTIEDIKTLAAISHEARVPFHTDAVQAVGHIPVNVAELGVDALSLSGHKFHGPRGTGALYLKNSFSIPPLIEGGAQERGERAGTENVAGIVGLAAALDEACSQLPKRMKRISTLRGRLVDHIVATVPDVLLTGPADPGKKLPSIASFVCKDVDGELLVVLLDRAGVAAATGSACTTGSTDPSHVITALGFTDGAWNHGSLRLSLPDGIDEESVDILCERVPRCIVRARNLSGMAHL